ncbi:hypothetical protein [Nocardia transvalensis]|uniref:hypothetical protein n=1 Tax=Nocardia transvalensis TaxID=37333 RepID=UPI001E65C26C|nr:hypothetical protein [Nocardia transvalensis]
MTARVGAVHLGWDVVSVAAGGGATPIRPVQVEGTYTPPAYLLADSSGRLHTAGVDRQRPDLGIAISDIRDVLGHQQIRIAGATWPVELVFRARLYNPLAAVGKYLRGKPDVVALPYPDDWPDEKVDEYCRLVELLDVATEPLPESVALSGYVRALGLVHPPEHGRPPVGATGVYSDGRVCLVVAVHGDDEQPTESVGVHIAPDAMRDAHSADNVVIEVMAAARSIGADTSTVLLTGNVCFNDALRLAFQNHLGHRLRVADHPMHALVLGAAHLLVTDSEYAEEQPYYPGSGYGPNPAAGQAGSGAPGPARATGAQATPAPGPGNRAPGSIGLESGPQSNPSSDRMPGTANPGMSSPGPRGTANPGAGPPATDAGWQPNAGPASPGPPGGADPGASGADAGRHIWRAPESASNPGDSARHASGSRPIEQGPRHVAASAQPLQRQPEPMARQPEMTPRHMDSPPGGEGRHAAREVGEEPTTRVGRGEMTSGPGDYGSRFTRPPGAADDQATTVMGRRPEPSGSGPAPAEHEDEDHSRKGKLWHRVKDNLFGAPTIVGAVALAAAAMHPGTGPDSVARPAEAISVDPQPVAGASAPTAPGRAADFDVRSAAFQANTDFGAWPAVEKAARIAPTTPQCSLTPYTTSPGQGPQSISDRADCPRLGIDNLHYVLPTLPDAIDPGPPMHI